jgi:ABC-2 type transport system ATP-binding protein
MDPSFEGESLLSIRNLTKQYGDLKAVDDVSLDIEPGEIFALLGPNGAGKTTLISCVTGLITKFTGSVEVAGYDVRDNPEITRRLVGLVPQELKYDAFFSVRDSLRYQGGFFGVRPDEERIDQLLRAFSLYDKRDQRTRWLSGGMQRRLMICKALMHDPVLLFLDEPTAGVDVELRDELWDYVRQMRDRGTTVVLTTHYLEEAEKLADRIGIIREGELLRVDDREELLTEYGIRRVTLQLNDPVPADLTSSLSAMEINQVGESKLEMVYREDSLETGEPTPVDELVAELVERGISIRWMEGGRSSLEEIFKKLVY